MAPARWQIKRKLKPQVGSRLFCLRVNKHDDAGADLPLDRVDRLQGQAGPSPCQTGLNLSGKCRSDKKSDRETDKEKVTHQLAMIPGETWAVTCAMGENSFTEPSRWEEVVGCQAGSTSPAASPIPTLDSAVLKSSNRCLINYRL